jgi:hypothetical protein
LAKQKREISKQQCAGGRREDDDAFPSYSGTGLEWLAQDQDQDKIFDPCLNREVGCGDPYLGKECEAECVFVYSKSFRDAIANNPNLHVQTSDPTTVHGFKMQVCPSQTGMWVMYIKVLCWVLMRATLRLRYASLSG